MRYQELHLCLAYNSVILGVTLYDKVTQQMYLFLQTDLAHHSPFTTALRNFGNNLRENEKGLLLS